MSRLVVKRPRAVDDLDDAAAYIQRHGSPERAIRFLQAADSTFALLADMPGAGFLYKPLEPTYVGLRAFPIARHRKYLVFYRPVADGVEIIRILHGARNLGGPLARELGLEEGGDEAVDEGAP